MLFHLYYRYGAGHGSRGPDIEANTIEEAFALVKNKYENMFEHKNCDEFYVTPSRVQNERGEWVNTKEYPRYTSYGKGHNPTRPRGSNVIDLYVSSRF